MKRSCDSCGGADASDDYVVCARCGDERDQVVRASALKEGAELLSEVAASLRSVLVAVRGRSGHRLLSPEGWCLCGTCTRAVEALKRAEHNAGVRA